MLFIKFDNEQIKNSENIKYFSHEYERLVTESKKLLTLIDEYAKNSDFLIEDASVVRFDIILFYFFILNYHLD